MNREEIKKILPHREPMLLLDECERTENGSIGKYKIRDDEFFLQGHFPHYAVVPGVILCEIMAQSCCLIFSEDIAGKTPFYAGIKNAKFKTPVRPGDEVEVVSEVLAIRRPFFMVKSSAYVGGKLAASGELTFCLKSTDAE